MSWTFFVRTQWWRSCFLWLDFLSGLLWGSWKPFWSVYCLLYSFSPLYSTVPFIRWHSYELPTHNLNAWLWRYKIVFSRVMWLCIVLYFCFLFQSLYLPLLYLSLPLLWSWSSFSKMLAFTFCSCCRCLISFCILYCLSLQSILGKVRFSGRKALRDQISWRKRIWSVSQIHINKRQRDFTHLCRPHTCTLWSKRSTCSQNMVCSWIALAAQIELCAVVFFIGTFSNVPI